MKTLQKYNEKVNDDKTEEIIKFDFLKLTI